MKSEFIFFVAVSAIICTVCGGVELQGCSNKTEELMKCVIAMRVITDDSEFALVMNKEDLNRLCPDLNRGIRCIHNYTRRCLTEERRMHFNQLYDGTTRVIQKLCHPGPYQQEFLSHVPCMRQVTTDYEACADRYQKKIGEVHQRINEQSKRQKNESATERMARENELRTVCCSFRDYLMCSQKIVRDTCGEKTANFTQDFLNQMSVSLIQAHCKNYPLNSEQCQEVAGGSAAPSLSLLNLFLALISFYFYHCT